MSIKFNGSSQSDAVAGAKAVAEPSSPSRPGSSACRPTCSCAACNPRSPPSTTVIANLNTQISSLSGASPPASQTPNQITDLVESTKCRPVTGVPAPDADSAGHPERTVRQRRQPCPRPGGRRDSVDEEERCLEDALSGLVAGLAVGLVAVIFGSLLAERALNRSTVADDVGRPGRVQPGALPPSTRHAQAATLPTTSRAEPGPEDDRTPAAWSSRIRARINLGGRDRRDRRAGGPGRWRAGAGVGLRGPLGRGGRRCRRSNPRVRPRPDRQA